MATNQASTANYLDPPEGRIAYNIDGTGPLVVLAPSIRDRRGVYRFLTPALGDAGYQVACTDRRGRGDSDATFTCDGDGDTAGDVLALVDALGDPAIAVGNSMAAGSAVLIASIRRPGHTKAFCLTTSPRPSANRPAHTRADSANPAVVRFAETVDHRA
jgi:pimeloyl-ACP methyl ester carboxylesterase